MFLPKLDSLKITHTSSFSIKSRFEIYPLTFTNSPVFCDTTKKPSKLSEDDFLMMIVVKNNKLYQYNRSNKLGPITFQIEDNKVSLTPLAVSKDGSRYFCCDNYIEELVDTGTDIICMSENIYFLYNNLDKTGKYINFDKKTFWKQGFYNKLHSREFVHSENKLDIRNIAYYYFDKNTDITILITKNFTQVVFIEIISKITRIHMINLKDYIENLDLKAEEDIINDIILSNSLEINVTTPFMQQNSKDFDINCYYDKALETYHFFIVKAMKFFNNQTFTLKLIEISFFWKNDGKSILKHDCNALNMNITNSLRSRDRIILRLHGKKRSFLIVLNKHMEIEIFFNRKYHGSLIKLENPLLKNINKIMDACWIGDFLLFFTGDMQFISFNEKHENVFFLENKTNFLSNYLRFPLTKPINLTKLMENTVFMMKNEEENCLVIYLDKNVFMINLENTQKLTSSDYIDDFLVPTIFTVGYSESVRPAILTMLNKIKNTDPLKLNAMKLFNNYKKAQILKNSIVLENNENQFKFKKLEKIMIFKLLEHLNLYKEKINLKYIAGDLNLNQFPFNFIFLNENHKKYKNALSNMNIDWFNKQYFIFSLSLAFLLSPALFVTFQKFPKKSQIPLNEKFCEKVLEMLYEAKILQILGFFQEKSINIKTSNFYGLSLIFLILFLEDLLIRNKTLIKCFSSLFLNDLLIYQEEKKPKIDDLINYIRKNSYNLIILENLEKNAYFQNFLKKVNLLNLLIYLLDYMNLHSLYLPLLRVYFKVKQLESIKSINILISVLLIILEKLHNFENLENNEEFIKIKKKELNIMIFDIFQEIVYQEKVLESEYIEEPCYSLMALLIIDEYMKDMHNIKKTMENAIKLYRMKFKLIMKFLKKHSNQKNFQMQAWEGSLLYDFVEKYTKDNDKIESIDGKNEVLFMQKSEKNMKNDDFSKKTQNNEKNDINDEFFIKYLHKTIDNILTFIGLAVDIYDYDISKILLPLNKKKQKNPQINDILIISINKLIKMSYFFYLKLRLYIMKNLEFSNKFEQIVLLLKFFHNFHKYEYKPQKFLQILEEFFKKSENFLNLSLSDLQIIGFYFNKNKEIFEKNEFLKEFIKTTSKKNGFEIGENFDNENYRLFAETFLDFIRKNYKKKSLFLDLFERINQHKGILDQLYQKYNKIFCYDLSKNSKNERNSNIFLEPDGKWHLLTY